MANNDELASLYSAGMQSFLQNSIGGVPITVGAFNMITNIYTDKPPTSTQKYTPEPASSMKHIWQNNDAAAAMIHIGTVNIITNIQKDLPRATPNVQPARQLPAISSASVACNLGNQLNQLVPMTNSRANGPKPARYKSCRCCDTNIERDYYGHAFKFPEQCQEHQECMSTNQEWLQHMRDQVHTKCNVAGCSENGIEFGTQAKLFRHLQNRHGDKYRIVDSWE